MASSRRRTGSTLTAVPPRWIITTLLVAFATQACEPWPRDPENTLEDATGGTLIVGAAEAPPLLMRAGGGADGPEAELVEAFARSIGARVEWRWGSLDRHLEALERFELHLVAAGLSAGSPWKRRVAFTRPWHEEGDARHVLAVPPGENRTLVALERLIESRKRGRSP